ncbi:hypothetical protein ES319_A12G106800v1 [Gossypium barbadense]|uniref:AB hydrolase-1 domain-containing protein n=1 Tax=Gossypium barbadense TaxID=3634 RepID=A0A5J5T941_GOSBA|nr:hypothetical protein ES319_A12G106800v1 [Gossypium barbadense]
MEVVSQHSPPCCNLNRRLLVKKRSSRQQVKIPLSRKRRILCSKVHYRTESRALSNKDHPLLNGKVTRPFKLVEGFGGDSNGYVIGSEDEVGSMSETGDSVTSVLIPGLPDESNGECGAPISSCFWEWKPKFNVHYEISGSQNVNSPPLIFLPGFGVGSFHYEKQLKDLGRDYREDLVWGFGDKTEPWATDLVYSMDLWKDQVLYFVGEVIGEPVYLVGNSLGGFVALYFAARNPKLVKGVTLLNATPFWGFLPNPIKSPRLARIFSWSGTFPLPENIRKLTEFVWQRISDPECIADVLRQVYADHSFNVDNVFHCILETTQHPAAAASFASIMFAPQAELSFREALSRCDMNSVPICLMYGKEDPRVKPVWGLEVKKHVPEAPYYEISPAGHCPHDEVPEVVNYLLHLEFVRQGSNKFVIVRFMGSSFSLWNRL